MTHIEVPATAQPAISPESAVTAPIPEDLLVRVLEPYSYKGCRYLLDAEYQATADSVYAVGNFRIEESAYIRSTGHFNAAELILCFNQLAYSAFAPAILNEEIPVLRGWSISDYFDLQAAQHAYQEHRLAVPQADQRPEVLRAAVVPELQSHRPHLALPVGPVRHRVLGRVRRFGLR